MTTAAPEAPAAPATPAAVTPAATPASQPAAAPAANPTAIAQAAAGEPKKNTILGGEESKPGEVSKEGAPEKYADFKLPEGIEPNTALMDQFKATAKELGLSQESGQKLVDLQAQNVKAEIDARMSAFNAQVKDWEKQSRDSFGAEWQKQFGIASKTVERFGSPALRQMLNDSGLGNHPELVKFFARVGASISEDQGIDGRGAGGEAVPTEKLMYPTMEKKK